MLGEIFLNKIPSNFMAVEFGLKVKGEGKGSTFGFIISAMRTDLPIEWESEN
jgi:hypothetical protein